MHTQTYAHTNTHTHTQTHTHTHTYIYIYIYISFNLNPFRSPPYPSSPLVPFASIIFLDSEWRRVLSYDVFSSLHLLSQMVAFSGLCCHNTFHAVVILSSHLPLVSSRIYFCLSVLSDCLIKFSFLIIQLGCTYPWHSTMNSRRCCLTTLFHNEDD